MLSAINLNHNNNVKNTHLTSQNNRARIQFASNKNVYASFEKFMTGMKTPNDITYTPLNSLDPENDGKFSLKVAIKNYLKGIVSPITSMFKSIKSFMIGATVITATTVLCAVGLAPIVVATGITLGMFQTAKVIYKMLKAKNGDQVEQACYDAGIATTSLALSAMGAKASLRSIGIETKNMSLFRAILENYKHLIPAFSKGSFTIKLKFIDQKAKKVPLNAHKTRINQASKLDLLSATKHTASIKNPYEVLGVRNKASAADIKRAYRTLAKEFHPDKRQGSSEYFKEIAKANSLLNNATAKASIDSTISADHILKVPISLIPASTKDTFSN